MSLIQDPNKLAELCHNLAQHDFVALDTEFIRDRTYWPKLCLVQLGAAGETYLIDPLAPGMQLEPLFELLVAPGTIKVMHSARQDIEIFYHLARKIPSPLFDTQVAAMVCGFGDSVGYDRLAQHFLDIRIDKGPQYTDWARRPLTTKQLHYAAADVSHLQVIYEKLQQHLQNSGRSGWLQEELDTLLSEDIYRMDPDRAWQRIKMKNRSKHYRALIKSVAAWRERLAQEKNLPRNRIIRDEAIQEIASEQPESVQALAALRGVSKGLAHGPMGTSLLQAVAAAGDLADDALPPAPERKRPNGAGPVIELLKLLLKIRCEQNGVAAKLVANSQDLEKIALNDDADVPALRGWRREIFGASAIELKHGRLALTAIDGEATLVETKMLQN